MKYELYDENNPEHVWHELRRERDNKLNETMWIMQRHQRETAKGNGTTLDSTQYEAWLDYWQALADLPQNTVNPLEVVWPTEPGI